MARKVVPEQQAERREALLKATYQVLLEKPYKDVTLEDIAQRAGVSKGVTVYYFNTKEEIFLACWDWLIGRISARLRARVAEAPDPVSAVEAVVDSVFTDVRDLKAFYTIYLDFLSLGARHAAFGRINTAFYAHCRELNHAIVTEGIRQGVFRNVDLTEAAEVSRALIDGMSIQVLFEENPEAFGPYRDHCVKALLSYLRP